MSCRIHIDVHRKGVQIHRETISCLPSKVLSISEPGATITPELLAQLNSVLQELPSSDTFWTSDKVAVARKQLEKISESYGDLEKTLNYGEE